MTIQPIAVPRARQDESTAAAAPVFDLDGLRRLPETVQRWLGHTVLPGTPMYSWVELELEGQVRLGRWQRFTARQTLRPGHGFIWSATGRVGGLPVTGRESMTPWVANRVVRAPGHIPVRRAGGPDLLNDAAGRLAAQSVLVPTTYARADWEAGPTAETAYATWRIGRRVDRVRLSVADDGRAVSATLRRWGIPAGERYGRHPFGLSFEGEVLVGGVRLPERIRAGWWPDSERADEGEYLQARLVGATFHAP